MTGWHPPHAHNGYLDIVLSMGIVGLVVFMVGFIINVWRAGKLSKVSGVYAANWPFFVLLFFGKSSVSKIQRLVSVLAMGAVLTIIMWKIPTVVERFAQLDPQNIGRENPRARMAPVLWEMFLRNPVLGSGPDGYEFELTRRAMPYLIREQQLIVSHNLALLLLVETGILGLLLFAFGLGAGLAAAWRARLASCGALPLALLLPLAIGGATLCNPSHLLVFWVAMAYALAGAG